MAVYVDGMEKVSACRSGKTGFRYIYSCHMMADTDKELEAMARRLKLRKQWKQKDHYDLTVGKRKLAVSYGAKEVSIRELIEIRRKIRDGVSSVRCLECSSPIPYDGLSYECCLCMLERAILYYGGEPILLESGRGKHRLHYAATLVASWNEKENYQLPEPALALWKTVYEYSNRRQTPKVKVKVKAAAEELAKWARGELDRIRGRETNEET